MLLPARVDWTRPVRVGDAPAWFSTSTVVDVMIRFDVNGYYLALGVSTGATRGEIRRAYQRLGGERSPWLTYVVSLLLHPGRRRRYDALPLGYMYRDRYLWLAEVRLHKRAAGRAMALCGGDVDAANQWLRDNGYDYEVRKSSDLLDTSPPSAQHDSYPEFEYGYYLWESVTADPRDLPRWQAELVRAASERGITTTVAIGVSGPGHPTAEIVAVGRTTVVFLREGVQPDAPLAAAAVDQIAP